MSTVSSYVPRGLTWKRLAWPVRGAAAILTLLCSCGSPPPVLEGLADPPTTDAGQNPDSLSDAVLPRDFTFATSRIVAVNITVLDTDRTAISGVGVILLDDEKSILARGMTNATGVYSNKCTVPAHVASLNVSIDLVGRVNSASIPIADDETATWIFE